MSRRVKKPLTKAERAIIEIAIVTGRAMDPKRPFGLFAIWLGVALGWGKRFVIDEPGTYVEGYLQSDMVFITKLRARAR